MYTYLYIVWSSFYFLVKQEGMIIAQEMERPIHAHPIIHRMWSLTEVKGGRSHLQISIRTSHNYARDEKYTIMMMYMYMKSYTL